MSVRVREQRIFPWFQVSKAETARLAEAVDTRSLPYARSLYFALLELANDHRTSEAAASRGELAERAGISPATVKRLTPALVGAGLVHVEEVPGYASVWTLLGVGSDRPGGSGHVDPGVGSASRGGSGLSDPALKETVKKERELHSPSVNGGWVGVPDEMLEDAVEALGRKTKVSGRLVTDGEMQRAASSLAEFNRQLERSFSIQPHLDIIVRRVREHPSWDPDKHVRLVASACRLRWWERNGRRRPPTPKVIWGSPECFENVAQDAAREAAVVREREEDFALHDKTWPDGRRWPELSAREQQVAREAVMMGLKPWEPDPVATVASGNGHAPGWTAENFADDD